MSQLRALGLRLAGLFGKARKDRELSEELESHLQMHVADNIRSGMDPAEARRQALIQLGGLEQTKERYRERRGFLWLESLLQDLRFGARMLRKSPGFTAVAILTLALGIGANTVMFSVVDRVLLNPFPFPEPDRLVMLRQTYPGLGNFSISYPNFLDWQDQNRSFEAMAALRDDDFTLTGEGEAELLRGTMVSADFFSVLGVPLLLGRDFRPEEDQLGATPVVVLGEALWRDRFAADANVLGTGLALNGKVHAVIGIVPSFRVFGTSADIASDDVYIPIGQWDEQQFRMRNEVYGTIAIGRLKPGVTLPQARADMDQVATNLAAANPEIDRGVGVSLAPLRDVVVGDLQPIILLLLGAVAFVLLIVCANVAGLLLARSIGRTREIAIRAALGASGGRIIRQLLTESVLLSTLGGLAGIALAGWGTNLALQALPVTLPGAAGSGLNVRVLVFSLAVSVLTGILFGLAPALASRPNVQQTLKEGARGATGRMRTQGFLTATEVALALILLVGAGLTIRSLAGLWGVDPGFDPHGVLTLQTRLPPISQSDPEEVRARFRQLEQSLASLPGVESSSVQISALPVTGNSFVTGFWVEGQPRPTNAAEARRAIYYPVGPDHFRVMRIPLLGGRAFTWSDDHSAPKVAVVDESLAASVFPGQDPIGKRVNVGVLGLAEIVGVTGHVKHWGLGGDGENQIQAQIYLPYAQLPDDILPMLARSATAVLRSSVPPAPLAGLIRQTVRSQNSDQVLYNVRTMDDIVETSLAEQRLAMLLLTIFAGIALLLAAVGIYGVLSYLVNQRAREIGIRMAVGAQQSSVRKMVIGGGMKTALVGVAIGIVGALALTRFLSSLLYGVTPTDPATFVVVTLVLLAAALLACYIPARRATKVDPITALRYE